MAEQLTCAGSLEFKSHAVQILHSIANGSPPHQVTEWPLHYDAKMGTVNSLHASA